MGETTGVAANDARNVECPLRRAGSFWQTPARKRRRWPGDELRRLHLAQDGRHHHRDGRRRHGELEVLQRSRGVPVRGQRFAPEGRLRALFGRVLDPAPVTTLVQEGLAMGKHGVCERAHAEPPAEQQKPEGGGTEAVLSVGRGGGHTPGSVGPPHYADGPTAEVEVRVAAIQASSSAAKAFIRDRACWQTAESWH